MNIDPAQSSQLQRLIDRQALLDLVQRYCVAVDRHDYDALRELYHEDAYDDHGSFNRGSVDTFIDALRTSAPYTPVLQHHVTTTDFAIDGCRAEGEIYVLALHTIAVDDARTHMLIGGRYLDKYERRDGNWKFLRRTIVTDWAQVQDNPSAGISHPMVPKGSVGAPGPEDPSYAYFNFLRESPHDASP